MSSPTRRSILSPSKNHNISKTPLKSRNNSPFNSSVKIPKLNNQNILTPIKKNPAKKPKLGFTIFEDKPSPLNKSPSKSSSPTTPLSQLQTTNRLDHNDQENILQPKVLGLKQFSQPRRAPLSNLCINEFPGYANFIDGNDTSSQMTEPYFPSNYKNDSINLHKFNSLPSFVTPPRKNLVHNDKYMYKSDSKEILDDEAEVQLINKQRQMLLKSKHSQKCKQIQPKKRSMSVDKNDLKLPLIKKNDFNILQI